MKKVKKLKKSWVNDEVLHLIALRGEMELEFAKNAKKIKCKICYHPFKFFFPNNQIQIGPIQSAF